MNEVILLLLGAGLVGAGVLMRQRQVPAPGPVPAPAPAPQSPIAQAVESAVQAVRPPVYIPQLPAVQGFAPLRPGVDQGLPRGIRNNNPGNIRATGTQWAGQVGRDPDFVVFSDPVYGIRAMVRILRSYRARGIVSMGDIIATWAPPHENDTQGYVAFVERETGLGRRQTIGEAEYPALIGAITRKENSINPYSAPQYAAGIAAANTEGVYA